MLAEVNVHITHVIDLSAALACASFLQMFANPSFTFHLPSTHWNNIAELTCSRSQSNLNTLSEPDRPLQSHQRPSALRPHVLHHSSKSTLGMDSSRLNDLPGELRNRIYRLALVQHSNIEIQVADSTKFSNSKHNALALLSTCRQIRAEATPIFFTENIFEIQTDLLSSDSRYFGPTGRQEAVFHHTRFMRMLIGGWLVSIDQYARHIKHIKFSIGS